LDGDQCVWLDGVLYRSLRALGVAPGDLPPEGVAALQAIAETARAEREALQRVLQTNQVRFDGFVTVKEAALLERVSPRAIQLRCQAGRLAFRRAGRRLLVDPTSLGEASEAAG
jgi:hypothetical protein